MNKDIKALIDRIEIDEHLDHYQKLTLSQRADLLGGMFRLSSEVKGDARFEKRKHSMYDRKLTPGLCRKLLKRLRVIKT